MAIVGFVACVVCVACVAKTGLVDTRPVFFIGVKYRSLLFIVF